MSLLSLENASVTYQMKDVKIHAVNDVSLEVEEQDSIGIVGESGSGKSTLAMMILKLLPQSADIGGKCYFDGKEILTMSQEEFDKMRWVQIAAVFQKSMNALSPVHKIGKQMMNIYKVHFPEAPKEEVKDRVMELLEMVNLPKRVFNLYQHELSGGMMQRVSIAVSLMFNPRLLIMDEATTALDVITESQILEEIINLEKKLKITRLMITHDMSIVANTCKKVAVMYAGFLLEYGYVIDVIGNPKHPYTVGLLKSFPDFKGKRSEIYSMEGSLPDLSKLPEGCVFAPRCKFAQKQCFEKRPPVVTYENGRKVMCHLAKEEE